jgi:hypothetical protein
MVKVTVLDKYFYICLEYSVLPLMKFLLLTYPKYRLMFISVNRILTNLRSRIFSFLSRVVRYCILPGLLLLSTMANPQDCAPFSIPYPNMGVNLPDAVGMPWVNLWNQVNPWHSGYFGNPKSGNDLELGPDGWP